MADPKRRSREENVREMQRLQAMYQRLPPEKQKAARAHMQARLNDLQAAIDGKASRRRSSGGLTGLQTALIVLLAAIVALGIGFFGVTFLAQG